MKRRVVAIETEENPPTEGFDGSCFRHIFAVGEDGNLWTYIYEPASQTITMGWARVVTPGQDGELT